MSVLDQHPRDCECPACSRYSIGESQPAVNADRLRERFARMSDAEKGAFWERLQRLLDDIPEEELP